MNDAEQLRKDADYLRSFDPDDFEDAAVLAQIADDLTSLADRLETHALVPREPTEAMVSAGDDELCGEFTDCRAIYRAMLTASEAPCEFCGHTGQHKLSCPAIKPCAGMPWGEEPEAK